MYPYFSRIFKIVMAHLAPFCFALKTKTLRPLYWYSVSRDYLRRERDSNLSQYILEINVVKKLEFTDS